MTKKFSKVFSVITILALMLMALPMQSASATGTGAISLTALGSAYTQDFNTLAITGTANTNLPLGWYLTESGGGARDNEAYAADNGSSGTGDTYSYGATGVTERAFGGLLSGTLVPILGASFTNNTGSTISQLNINYIGEQWRIGALARAEQIDFQISNDATSLDIGVWTDVNSLDFASPVQTGTVGALNGNVAPNRTAVGNNITGLNIPNGATFWIRWMDFNASGADDGLSVDDFSLTPIFIPTPTNPTGIGLANPTPVTVGSSTLLTIAVTPGTSPTSTGLAVTCDLSPIGGLMAQTFFDDNSNGDVTAGDNTFSFQAIVGSGTSAGAKSLPCTITDVQVRSSNVSIALTVQSPPPPAGSVVVSQVYGGGGNGGSIYKNDFIELYNRTASPISLAGWSVQYAAAAGSSWSVTTLSGSIAPGKYYLVQEAAGAGGTLNLPAPDAIGTIAMSATAGKVALVNNAVALTGTCPSGSNISDFVGFGTTANCFEGSGTAPAPSNITADLRAGNGATDTDNNATDFVAGAPNPRNSHDPAPTVSSTTPANGAVGVDLAGNITINFSEPVNATGAWFTIACATSGAHTATVSGGPTTFVLDPDTNFLSLESCTVTVVASQVTDQDTDDPPDTMDANYVFSFTSLEVLVCGDPATPIHNIQGSGTSSPMAGTANVVIEGVVVGDYQNTTTQFSGFHVQEENAQVDADPLTSEGIFVFDNGFGVNVNPGDMVRVRGTVSEFSNLTELGNVNVVQVCSTGNTVTPANVTLPVANLNDWERYEGMLVNITQDLTATETFTLGRFGEVSLSVNGRLHNPTNIVAPGAPAIAQQDLNDRSRILLDDGNGQQNIDPTIHPIGGLDATNTLRSGYTVHGLTGVLEQRFGVYRVQPVGLVSFDASTNPRTLPSPVGGNLKVAALNVLNFFTSLDTGSPICGPTGGLDCRGANSAFEFNRQRTKIVNSILAINPDIAGLMEVQNDASATIQNLVDGLNDVAGAGTYAFINTGTIGTDAIKVAIIYKPAVVTPVGVYKILDSSVNPLFIDTKNRPTLVQTFMRNANGAKLTVVVNHLKSKGSDCNDLGDPDIGDGQGNCNVTRTKAATALVSWLASDPTGSGDPDFLVVGDMNSYAKEDPITTIKNGGYTNLLETIIGADAYSYVFDGQSGYLDHALASSNLTSQVVGVTEWHNNADEPVVLDYNIEFKTANQVNTFYTAEPYRASDHDPVIVGLNLNDPPTVDAGGPYSANEGGSVFVAATGNDPDINDTLTYAWDLDNNGSFETAGQSATFSAAGLDGPTSRTIKVRATDNDGLTAVDVATVNILNVAPSVNAPTVSPEPSIKGSAVTASATFSDPAPSDAPFTCTVNYGDGSGNLSGSVSGNTCTGPSHVYANVGSFTVTVSVTDKDSDTGSNSTSHAVLYNFAGFFQPVDNLPVLNVVKAGQAIPVKFSLNGNQGLTIFAAGAPGSQTIICNSGDPQDAIEQTVSAGSSSLSYDPITDTYTYIWKTDKAWANTCRKLIVTFNDGTTHIADFSFTK